MIKMFNIFRDEGEKIDKSTQLHELFRSVKQIQLQEMVKALGVRSYLDSITYSKADNHLTAAVSKMLEYQLYQKVSGIQASGGNSGGNNGSGSPRKGGHNSGSIYNSQGKLL